MRVWLIIASCGLLPLAGCQDFNPYLGAASTQASTITFITPSSRPAGCSGFTLDVKGIGFGSTDVVDWNGSPRTTNFESTGELLATINDSDIATQVPVSIVVNTPLPAGQQNEGNNLSNFVTFTIAPTPSQGTSACPAAPTFPATLTGLDASSGDVGATIEIAGNYFGGVQGTSTVTFNGISAAVTSWSGTLIVVTVPSVPLPNGATSITASVLVNVNGVASLVPNAGSNLFTILGSSTGSRSPVGSSDATAAVAATGGTRYIAYVAADSPAATGTGVAKVYLRDTCFSAPAGCSPTTIPISLGFDGTDPNGASRAPSVSTSGRFVAFASDANNLVRGDANGASDIFVRDTCIGAPAGCVPSTARVSLGPEGTEPNGASSSPSISADGRFVAFQSVATNLDSDIPVNVSSSSEGRFLWDSCFGAANGCRPSLTRLRFLTPSSR